jgi:hypothetical protein
MRVLRITLLSISLSAGAAVAQNPSAGSDPPASDTSQKQSLPGSKQPQGQGDSGPMSTTTGGAPASSPQGDAPPGMQVVPKGEPEQAVDPQKK